MAGKRKIFIAVITTALAGIAIFAAGSVLAAETTHAYAPIVQKLAERFNLDAGEVDEVFQAEHKGRREDMRERHAAQLDQAVRDGKISKAQKKAILKKMDENHAAMLKLKDTDHDARHKAMRKLHDDFKKWLKDNNIDPAVVGPAGGCGMMGKGAGMRGPGMMKHKPGMMNQGPGMMKHAPGMMSQ